jgi:hypothetical protein
MTTADELVIVFYNINKKKYTFLNYYFNFLCLLHISIPRVHLQKDCSLYSYGTAGFTCRIISSIVGRRGCSKLVIENIFSSTRPGKKTLAFNETPRPVHIIRHCKVSWVKKASRTLGLLLYKLCFKNVLSGLSFQDFLVRISTIKRNV